MRVGIGEVTIPKRLLIDCSLLDALLFCRQIWRVIVYYQYKRTILALYYE